MKKAVLARIGVAVALSMATILGLVGVSPAAAETRSNGEVLRVGTIVGGHIMTHETDCRETPDCHLWLDFDCRSDLVNEPALFTSITNVADLAGRREVRTFKLRLRLGWGFRFGGATIQFWTESCEEVESSFRAKRTPYFAEVDDTRRFTIPSGTKWMTVATWDVAHVEWTLK